MDNVISSFFRPKNGPSLVLVLIGLLWFGAISLRATDRYVVPTNDTTHVANPPYVNWTDAATNILDAVNVATNNDTVWVSNGVYVLTNQIVVTSNIVLRSANGPDVTIVNGNFVLDAPGATTNNRCLYLSNSSAFVSGFTFSNGAVFANAAYIAGGGVRIGAGIMSNCTVRNNTVFTLDDNLGTIGGGGVYIGEGSTVMVCRVTDNVVTSTMGYGYGYGRGGGIYAYGATVTGCKISDCVISNNVLHAGSNRGYGGAVYLYFAIIRSSMICNNDGKGGKGSVCVEGGFMESCTATVNQVKRGGGCYIFRGTVTNCVISYNTSSSGGGGIYMGLNADSTNSVFNTTIIGNTNDGVRMDSTATIFNNILNCDIIGNQSNGVSMVGSGNNNYISNCVIRANIGGISNLTGGTIRNCLIANNTNNCNVVGGLLISSSCSTVMVSSCTIVSNWGTNFGAGIRIEATNANLLISSCIIYSNGIGGTNDVYDACAPTNYNALQYSCVGLNPGFTGAVIIVTNPMFQNFAGGNYRLSVNSPCINRGSNETWMTNFYDLDGRTRIRYGRVDMGAYEVIRDGTVYGFR